MSEQAILLVLLVPGLSILVILFTVLVSLWLARRLERLNALPLEWAERHGFRILERDRRFFFRGPFFFSSGYADVSRLTVQDRQGSRRTGWVKIGAGPLGSLLSDRIDVVWDDVAPLA